MNTRPTVQLSNAKHALQKWLSLSVAFITFFFSILNMFFLKQPNIAVIEGLFCILNIYLFIVAKRSKHLPWQTNILLFSFTFTTIFTFYTADLRAGSIYWLLLLPPIYCILTNPKKGFICTVLLSFPAVFILFLKSDTDSYIPYRSALNFTVAYYSSYIVCYFYESQYLKHNLLLNKMAFEDSLTRLQNRHALKLFFESHNQPTHTDQGVETPSTWLLIIDIDHFKKINDQFGHDVGDSVLMKAADLIKNHASDQHVYRIGGEEFLVILDEKTWTQAYQFAESLRLRIEKFSFAINKHDISLTVSIGIDQFEKGQDFNDFLYHADKNLYSAKNLGRNTVHYAPPKEETKKPSQEHEYV